jgi:transposase
MAPSITTLHVVCDHVSTPHGPEVRRWLSKHPRWRFHCTPVHGSWMNHVEQWCSLLQRTRLSIIDVASKDHLRAKLDQLIDEWNQQAHPFHWSTTSVAKVMAEVPAMAA